MIRMPCWRNGKNLEMVPLRHKRVWHYRPTTNFLIQLTRVETLTPAPRRLRVFVNGFLNIRSDKLTLFASYILCVLRWDEQRAKVANLQQLMNKWHFRTRHSGFMYCITSLYSATTPSQLSSTAVVHDMKSVKYERFQRSHGYCFKFSAAELIWMTLAVIFDIAPRISGKVIFLDSAARLACLATNTSLQSITRPRDADCLYAIAFSDFPTVAILKAYFALTAIAKIRNAKRNDSERCNILSMSSFMHGLHPVIAPLGLHSLGRQVLANLIILADIWPCPNFTYSSLRR